MKKRLIAVFLSIVMVIGVLPTMALAADESTEYEYVPVTSLENDGEYIITSAVSSGPTLFTFTATPPKTGGDGHIGDAYFIMDGSNWMYCNDSLSGGGTTINGNCQWNVTMNQDGTVTIRNNGSSDQNSSRYTDDYYISYNGSKFVGTTTPSTVCLYDATGNKITTQPTGTFTGYIVSLDGSKGLVYGSGAPTASNFTPGETSTSFYGITATATSNNLDDVQVTFAGGKITDPKTAVVWKVSGTSSSFTLTNTANANQKLYSSQNSRLSAGTTASTCSFDGAILTIASSRYVRYDKTNTRFTADTTVGNVQFWKKTPVQQIEKNDTREVVDYADYIPPVLANGWMADSSAHNLVKSTATVPEDCTVYYIVSNTTPAADDSGWKTAIPTAKDAGSYTVWFKVVSANDDYDDMKPTELGTVTVAAAGSSDTLESGKMYKETSTLTSGEYVIVAEAIDTEATLWTLTRSGSTGSNYYISTTVGTNTYYLRNNSGTLQATTSTSNRTSFTLGRSGSSSDNYTYSFSNNSRYLTTSGMSSSSTQLTLYDANGDRCSSGTTGAAGTYYLSNGGKALKLTVSGTSTSFSAATFAWKNFALNNTPASKGTEVTVDGEYVTVPSTDTNKVLWTASASGSRFQLRNKNSTSNNYLAYSDSALKLTGSGNYTYWGYNATGGILAYYRTNSSDSASGRLSYSGGSFTRVDADATPKAIKLYSLLNAEISVSDALYTYGDGQSHMPTIGTYDTTAFTLRYSIGASEPGTYSTSVDWSNTANAGTYTVWVALFNGDTKLDSAKATVTVNPKPVSNPLIVLDPTSYTYDGTAKTPSVTAVKDGSTTIASSAYSVSYSKNTNAGAGVVTITDNNAADNYVLSGVCTFIINPAPLTITAATITPRYYDEGNTSAEVSSVTLSGTVNGETLTLGTDYTASGEFDDDTVGADKDVAVTLAAVDTSDVIKNYSFPDEPFTASGEIMSSSFDSDNVSWDENVEWDTENEGEFIYDGTAKEPAVVVMIGDTELTEDTDYEVTYDDNVDAAASDAASGAPTVTVTGIGNYDGSEVTMTFTILPKALTITAENKTIYVGESEPTYTYTVTGLAGDDTKDSVITTAPGFTVKDSSNAEMQDTNTAGTYTITPKDAATTNTNYTIKTYTPGTLTIKTAEQLTYPSELSDVDDYDSEDEDLKIGMTVTLDLDGGEFSSADDTALTTDGWDSDDDEYTLEITADEAIDITDYIPTKDGYVFNGWSCDADEDITLTAQWLSDEDGDGIPDKYQTTVTFSIENGTWDGSDSDDIEVVLTLTTDGEWDEDGTANLQASDIPTGMQADTGYGNGSWDVTPSTDTDIDANGATYTYTFNLNKVLTYSGELTVDGYEEETENNIELGTVIKLNLNGGDAFDPAPEGWLEGTDASGNVTYAAAVIDDIDIDDDDFIPTKEGYIFNGWSCNAGEIITLTAQWLADEDGDDIPDAYQTTVTFSIVNGTWDGTDSDDIEIVLELTTDGEWDENGTANLQALDIPNGMQADTGYGNGYWDVTPSTDTDINADGAAYTYTYTLNNSLSYYGKLTKDGYTPETENEIEDGTTVILDLNGGEYADAPAGWTEDSGNYTQVMTDNIDIGSNDFIPLNEGYLFDGWSFDDSEDITLTAQWVEDEDEDGIPDKYQVTVTFSIIDGTWEDGSDDDVTVTITLTDNEGDWSESGSGRLRRADIPTPTVPTGLNGTWLPSVPSNSDDISEDTAYVYSFSTVVAYITNGGVISWNDGEEHTEGYCWYDTPEYNAKAEKILETGAAGEKIITKEGFSFAGWYTDKELTKSWNFDDKVKTSMTLYAKWVENLYEITVNVSDGENPVTGAVITLKSGEDVRAEADEHGEGVYVFSNVAEGNYNIVVEKDDAGTTVAISVTDDAEVDVTLPTAPITTKIEEHGNTRDTSADLSGLVDDNVPQPGEDKVEVIMDIETIDASHAESGEARWAFEAIHPLTGRQKVEYIDIDISRHAYDGDTDTVTPINDIDPQLLAITIEFPTNGRKIYVYRYHDEDGDGVQDEKAGEIKLTQLLTGETPRDGTYTVGNNCVIIYSSYFSIYAIGYEEESSGNVVSGNHQVIGPDTTENGQLLISKEWAGRGETIRLTLTPDEGYSVRALSVTDAQGNIIPLEDEGNGVYSFTMPKYDVYVEVTFKGCPRDETCPIEPYTDTVNDYWWHDGIHYCVENELMVGTSDVKFQPYGLTSRAQIVMVLWRMAGCPVVNYAMSFKDVEPGTWYTEAIRWAQSANVVEGYDDEHFGPNDPVTREQLAAILYRYAKLKGEGFTGAWYFLLDFNDRAEVSSWADEAVHWCSMKNIVEGKDNKLFDPQGSATRAEVACMIQRYCEIVLGK